MCNYLPQKPISSKIRDVKLSNEAASPEMAKLVRTVLCARALALQLLHSTAVGLEQHHEHPRSVSDGV